MNLHRFAAVALLLAGPALSQKYLPTDAVPDYAVSRDATNYGRAFFFCKSNTAGFTTFNWVTTEPRAFIQYPDGTARLTGTIHQRNLPNHKLSVDLLFNGYVSQFQTPPTGSPKQLEIRDSALRQNGGPIDMNGWSYYTAMSGTLVGSGNLAGWRLRMTSSGPAFQIGYGANVKNGNFGGSSWFDVEFLARGSNWAPGGCGDINTDLGAARSDCIALHEFDRGTRNSTDLETCSSASPVAFGRPVQINSSTGVVTLRQADWATASDRARSVSQNAYIELRITPNANKRITLRRICLDIARSQSSVANVIDVRYDEDPGSGGDNFNTIVGTLALPNEAGLQKAFRRYCFDLDVSKLRNLTQETRVRLYVWGTSRFATRDDSQIDNICLEGDAGVKLPNIMSHTPTTLETITSDCILLRGCGFENVKLVNFGSTRITSKDPCNFGKGYFTIVSDTELCVYPPLCVPGTFSVSAVDIDDRSSNSVTVRMQNPTTFKLATPAIWDHRKAPAFWLWGKVRRPYYCVFASPFRTQSRIRGLVDLGIGNNFEILIPFDSPGSTCFEYKIGTWHPNVKGLTLYFQSIVIDLDNTQVFPIPATNITQTKFF